MQACFSGRSVLTPFINRAAGPNPACAGRSVAAAGVSKRVTEGCPPSRPVGFSTSHSQQTALLDSRRCTAHAQGQEEEGPVQYNQEFGYSRKDVLLIGLAFIGVGYALYYGAQAVGIEATTAGNYVQLLIFLIICVGYISTYIFRVANKDMTYAKQLEAYEERVMQKRLEEMPETERERLMEEVNKEQERRVKKGK